MFVKWYLNALKIYPWRTQVFTTGVIMASGDLICQTAVEKKMVREIEPVRVTRFALVGVIFVGPVLRSWYLALERICGVKGATVGFKKMILDQGLFAPFFLLNFFAIMSALQNKTRKEICEKIKQDYVSVLKTNYLVWPPVQLVTFYAIPFNYRLLFVNTVAVLWNTYLSWKANKQDTAVSET